MCNEYVKNVYNYMCNEYVKNVLNSVCVTNMSKMSRTLYV